MTKTQKKELKARFFKILHGICYVLSAIFVLVMIVAGVKGCGNKKPQQTPSQSLAPQQLYNDGLTNNYYYYVMQNLNNMDYSAGEMSAFSEGQVDCLNVYTSNPGYLIADVSSSGYFFNGNNLYNVNYFHLIYRPVLITGGYSHRLSYIDLYYGNIEDSLSIEVLVYDDDEDYYHIPCNSSPHHRHRLTPQ